MKNSLKLPILTAAAVLSFAGATSAAENLLINPDFEEVFQDEPPPSESFLAVPGWLNFGGFVNNGRATLGVPGIGAQQGSQAVQLSLTDPETGNINFLFQRLGPGSASPGDEFYGSVQILRELLPSPHEDGYGVLQIAFYDEQQNVIQDMAPASISKGTIGLCPYPAIGQQFDSTSLNTWSKLQVQGVTASANTVLVACAGKAPANAVEVGLFLFLINNSVAPAPIWFDNAILARLEPDDDGDRIENGVDNDPINVSTDFDDGITSGSIESDVGNILSIDDATEPNGIFVESAAAGPGTFARISVCGSLASIRVTPNSAFDVTCGSVILDVAPDSAPVELEIIIDGETAVVRVPANNSVTYEDDTEEISVDAGSTGETVTFTQGETVIELAAGETLDVPSVKIDIKPGDTSNCLNINGHGVIPVAVLGSPNLSVVDIDQNSLRFAGLDVRVKGNDALSCGIEDVNVDGFNDLVCQFKDDPENWRASNGFANLTGTLNNGEEISGTDAICFVP